MGAENVKTLKKEMVLKDFLIFILLFSDPMGPKSRKQVPRQLLQLKSMKTKHFFFHCHLQPAPVYLQIKV